MSDIGGFDWWFRDRDYVLRDSVETLYAESAAASRRASTISSQLSKLQGSIESRLNALIRAFDAYVELGDVREQLAAYAESAAVRREAMTAIAALGERSGALRVDDRGTDYWIAPATNAVIDRCSGSADASTEQRLADEHPQAKLFSVAATAAVGHGEEMAQQAVDLLRPVQGRLERQQLTIWRAARADVFGPDVWQRVVTGWAAELRAAHADGEPDLWWSWAVEQSRAEGVDVLDWLEAQPGAAVEPGSADATPGVVAGAEPGAAQGVALAELKELVVEVIGAGVGEEASLLVRARELRDRIEAPDPQPRDRKDERGQEMSASVIGLTQQAYQESAPGSADRVLLYSLVAPVLLAALEEQASSFLKPTSTSVKVTVPGGTVEVGPNGPESRSMARHTAAVQAMEPSGGRTLLVAGGVAVAAVIVALIGAITSVAALTIVMLIVAVIAGIVTLRGWLTQRRERQSLEERRRAWAEKLTDGQNRARRIDVEQREIRRRRADQLDRLRQHLR